MHFLLKKAIKEKFGGVNELQMRLLRRLALERVF